MAATVILNSVITGTSKASLLEGVIADRSAAGNTNRLYVATDTKVLYRDNGTSWDVIGAAGSGLEAVFTQQFTGAVSPVALGNIFTYTTPSGGNTTLYQLNISLVVSSIAVATAFKLTLTFSNFTNYTIDLYVNSTMNISAAGYYAYPVINVASVDGTNIILQSVAVTGAGNIVYDVACVIVKLDAVYAP